MIVEYATKLLLKKLEQHLYEAEHAQKESCRRASLKMAIEASNELNDLIKARY